jgi:hypothetical protein
VSQRAMPGIASVLVTTRHLHELWEDSSNPVLPSQSRNGIS